MHTRVYWKSDISLTDTHPIRIIQGIDWILEDNTSYEIFSQEQVGDKTIVKLEPRPRDWIGTTYLSTVDKEVQIVKQDKKGIWCRLKGLEYIHWNADIEDIRILEVWKRF